MYEKKPFVLIILSRVSGEKNDKRLSQRKSGVDTEVCFRGRSLFIEASRSAENEANDRAAVGSAGIYRVALRTVATRTETARREGLRQATGTETTSVATGQCENDSRAARVDEPTAGEPPSCSAIAHPFSFFSPVRITVA